MRVGRCYLEPFGGAPAGNRLAGATPHFAPHTTDRDAAIARAAAGATITVAG